jgi:hypothetical protein
MNGDSVELWREYVKMEMGWVEQLRRRWDVLGVEVEGEENESRQEIIMEGGIVKTVITNACQGERDLQLTNGSSVYHMGVTAMPCMEMFSCLHDVLLHYPTTPQLKEALMSHLHAILRETLPQPRTAAIRLLARRYLELKSVEGVQKANEVYLELGDASTHAEFVRSQTEIDANLVSNCLLFCDRDLLYLEIISTSVQDHVGEPSNGLTSDHALHVLSPQPAHSFLRRRAQWPPI